MIDHHNTVDCLDFVPFHPVQVAVVVVVVVVVVPEHLVEVVERLFVDLD
jgi:hypothetical protein